MPLASGRVAAKPRQREEGQATCTPTRVANLNRSATNPVTLATYRHACQQIGSPAVAPDSLAASGEQASERDKALILLDPSSCVANFR